jgi:hypothetical protein
VGKIDVMHRWFGAAHMFCDLSVVKLSLAILHEFYILKNGNAGSLKFKVLALKFPL